jgi:predicted nuclease with TOPRIM domain
MGKHHKTFPRNNGESGEVRELKDKIKRLASDKRKLIAELQTLKAAFQKTSAFIEEKFEGITVEEVLDIAKDKKSKKESAVEMECVKCHSTKLTHIKQENRHIVICNNCKNREVYVFDP